MPAAGAPSSSIRPTIRPLHAQVLGVLMVLFLGGIAGIVTVGYWTAATVDQRALARQTTFVQRGLNERFMRVPVEQESVTIWDDAFAAVKAGNMPWLDENIGLWMNSYFGHDESYVLTIGGRPLYAAQGDQPTAPETFETVRDIATPVLRRLQYAVQVALSRGSPSHASIGELSTTDFTRVGDDLAIVSARPIVPSSVGTTPSVSPAYVLLSIVKLDGQVANSIAEQYDVNTLHFETPATQVSDLPAVPIVASGGEKLGYLQWQPNRPGWNAVSALLPLLAFSVLMAAAIAAWLVNRLWRASLDLEAREEQTRFLAYHDTLTGLANRVLLDEKLDRAVHALRAGTSDRIALHLLDIDRFKNINDTLGHPMGDELVSQIAGRLRAIVSADETIARIGGDEFVVVQSSVASNADACGKAEQLLGTFATPFDLGGETVVVTASIGLVVTDEGGATSKGELLRRADIALYEAKGKGRGRHQLFNRAMDDTVRRRRLIERDLRTALETGTGLILHYQPQFGPDGTKIVGVEALVRWMHPTRGLLYPDAFISVAEERGLIADLGRWTLRKACETLRDTTIPRIAVNVSPIQFREDSFANCVLATLRETGVSPRRLELEITEGVLLEEGELADAALTKLRAAGISIALDDFGTGYSSMHYLHRYAVDKIKIDQTFVRQLGKDRHADAIIRAIIALARAMDRRVAAEGVENIDQRDHLVALGCHELQGFFLSKPISEDALRALLVGDPGETRLRA